MRALGLSLDLEEPMVVRNFPNKILNSTQLHLLNQGLNHSIFPKKLNLADVQAEFELLYQQSRGYFTVEQRLKLKQTLMSLFAKYFLTFFHERMTNIHALSLTELNSLKKFAKDPNIIVSKFDKGNGVATLNTSDYKEKMLKILNDRTKFVLVGKDDNLQKLDQFQRCIRYLKGKGAITNEDYQRIYLTSAATPTMYGLPKVHKDGIPLRPILASTGSFNHECAKWFSDILSPLRSHSTNLKDTFSLTDEVKNLSLNDSVMYSFDIVSLFINIPLQFTLQLILDTIFKDNIETFYNLNKRRLKTLLNWAASSTTLQFQGKYYEQVDGIAMGSPIAPMLADVFMNYVIEEALSASQQNRPTVLLRYMNDLFLVFSGDEKAQSFFGRMNRIYKSINFTQEQECNGQLAFLNVLVSRNTGNVAQTFVLNTLTSLVKFCPVPIQTQFSELTTTTGLQNWIFIQTDSQRFHEN